MLFKQKWWQIGRFGKRLANEETAREDEKAALGARTEQVENVEVGRKENEDHSRGWVDRILLDETEP